MKKLILILTCTLVINSMYAQTADEIITKYFTIIGGQQTLENIKTLHIFFNVKNQGMEFQGHQYKIKDGKELTTIEFQGKELYQPYFDGTDLWSTNFMTMKLEKADNETTENYKNNEAKEIVDPFLNYKEKGYLVQRMNDEVKEGVNCYTIKLTKNKLWDNGDKVDNIEYYYFDKENGVPLVSEKTIHSGQMAGKKTQTVFGNFQEIDGVYFPFSIINKFDGQEVSSIEVKSVEINQEIPDQVFDINTADATLAIPATTLPATIDPGTDPTSEPTTVEPSTMPADIDSPVAPDAKDADSKKQIR